MKKILLIGAGIGQINLALKIKERGHFLLVIAYNSLPQVVNIADKFIQHDLFDYDGVLKIAQSESIDAVISDQHDIMAPLVAYIAENMELPGNTYATLMSYCDKNTFRDNCDKIGIPAPKHIKVKKSIIPEEFKNVPYPWIVKPADSQSSVGVNKVHTDEECINALISALSYSRSNTAIIEEFFVGKELVAEGFIWNGEYFNIGYADRKYFKLDNLFIPSQTIFPSILPQNVLDRIQDYEKAMASYIHPNFGIVHSEYLYNEDKDEIRIVESGLRGGGVFISSHLLPHYSGIDVNDLLLDAVEGKTIEMNKVLSHKKEKASAYVCFYLPEGKISSIKGIQELQELSSVIMINLDGIKVGDMTRLIEHKGQRLGPILLVADNVVSLNDEIRKVQSILDIVVENNGSRNSIQWE